MSDETREMGRMIIYTAWCAVCGAMVCTPDEWKNHEHLEEALSLEEIEHDNPHFPIHD